MSVLSRDTNITPNSCFFLLANVSTLKSNNIQANTISTGKLFADVLTAKSSLIEYLSTNYIDAESISTNNIDASTIYSSGYVDCVELSSIYCYIGEGYVSSLRTEHIILDQATLDVAGGSVLLLNGVPIATTSTSVSSLTEWSFYPALSTLNMAGNNLSNVGNMTSQNIYNALNIQTDTLSALTSATAPSATFTNARITNLSSTNFVASNAFAPLANFTTLNAGSVSTGIVNGLPFVPTSNWSFYPAQSNINLQTFGMSNSSNLNITAVRNINLSNSSGGLVNYNTNINTGDFTVVADQGLDATNTANLNLTAQGGSRGVVAITANAGVGTSLYGEVDIVANGGSVGGIGTGGLITLTANTPLGFSNATSAIKLSGAGINSYAGATPSFGSGAGYNFIHGDAGVNITSGLASLLPNTVGTTYIYGTAGVEIPSDAYMKNIYPYWDSITTPPDLTINGRYIVPNLAQVCVRMSNVRQIYFQENVATFISNCDLISMSSNGNITTSNIGATTGTIGTLGFTTANGTTVNSGAVNTNTVVASNSVSAPTVNTSNLVASNTIVASNSITAPLMSTLDMRLSSINSFTSFGSKSIRVLGDVAQIQLSNNNVSGQGSILNLLSRPTYTEIQSFNSNFTAPLNLYLNASTVLQSTNNTVIQTVRQPFIQYSTVATSGGSGSQQVQFPIHYKNSNYASHATMNDTQPAQMAVQNNSVSSMTIYWSNGGGGNHSICWTTYGDV